jgi:hypothetical protein
MNSRANIKLWKEIYERHFFQGVTYRFMAKEKGLSAQRIREMSMSYKSHLTKRAPDAGDSAASQALSPLSGESTPEVVPAATQRR